MIKVYVQKIYAISVISIYLNKGGKKNESRNYKRVVIKNERRKNL